VQFSRGIGSAMAYNANEGFELVDGIDARMEIGSDVILFLRTNNKYIMDNLNSTGIYIMGKVGLMRPKMTTIKTKSNINKKDYEKKLKEGKSMTPEGKGISFSNLLNKMDIYK
jgi:hypothetical protein